MTEWPQCHRNKSSFPLSRFEKVLLVWSLLQVSLFIDEQKFNFKHQNITKSNIHHAAGNTISSKQASENKTYFCFEENMFNISQTMCRSDHWEQQIQNKYYS